ncbi:MAG: murein biosynthesis integral membrane protein MurJ [Marmoricola sp.]
MSTGRRRGGGGSLLGSSAVMAGGTVVSRLSGFVRNALLVAALGSGLHADLFNVANTVPNMLYILLAGGVFNAVLVPQLVRAMQRDEDGGAAYTNRIITLAALFLAGASAVLVIAAPLLMRLFLDDSFFTASLAAQRESAIAFARYCLPQVFFYGMFVLVGQVLNARGSFGPMMWAPITNNVVSVAVLGAYLAVFGPAVDVCRHPDAAVAATDSVTGPFGSHQELLLGLGSTLGIAVQLLVLLPFLRAAGFRFHPRFDFRGTGLGHTLRLGVWTVLYVVVNQVAYTVVVRLASSGPASAAGPGCGAHDATGYTVYSFAFLLVMVPHSVITVSLATAALPRLARRAADGDLAGLATQASSVLRTTYVAMVPILAVVPVVAPDLVRLVYGYGASSGSAHLYARSVSLFAVGVFFFTTHYLVLRGFYALEENRRVFAIQCVVAATNIVAAVLLVRGASPAEVAPRLVIAYTLSYAVGAAVSLTRLRRRLGGFDGHRLLRFVVRLGAATAVATALSWVVLQGLEAVLPGAGKAVVVLRLLVTGAVQVGVVGVLAQRMRVREVQDVVALVRGRLGRG